MVLSVLHVLINALVKWNLNLYTVIKKLMFIVTDVDLFRHLINFDKQRD